jgi:hypothetical protein
MGGEESEAGRLETDVVPWLEPRPARKLLSGIGQLPKPWRWSAGENAKWHIRWNR